MARAIPLRHQFSRVRSAWTGFALCVAAALLLAWASWDTRVSGLAMVVPGPIIASGSAFLVAPMPSLEQTRKLVSWILLLLVGFSHPIWCPGLFVVTSELMQPGSMGGVLWIVASAAPYLVLCTFLAGARIALAVFTGGALLGAMALGAGDRFQDVGRLLGEKAARHLKRYTAELGGHAPVIVCADADPVAAAKLSVTGKFRNAGQVCASPIRFLVQRGLYDRFREEFLAGTAKLKVGPGLEAGVQLGPLIHERRITAMREFVDDAVACGARLLCGGRRVARPGFFFEPTVLEAAPPAARVQREEPFGPIALLDVFDTLDEAIARANALPYGLAAYGFTRDLKVAHELGQRLRAGMVGINHFGISQPETPFGGVGESGMGSESGLEGLLAYTDVKLVSIGA
mgnify:CR=1 FL=1